MKNALRLLVPAWVLLGTPASANDGPWWCGTRAEYGADYQAARATASLCWGDLAGLAEYQRQASNQRILAEYQLGLPNQLLAPRYYAPLLPRR